MKARALEAVGEADKRHASSQQAVLVQGMEELDDAVKRASRDRAASEVATLALVAELRVEEAEVRAQLDEVKRELDLRLGDEDRERRHHAAAKAAAQAVQQASLQRELRTLQRQLVYGGSSSLALPPPEPYHDDSSEALWAALLAEPSAEPAYPPFGGADPRPPHLTYAPADEVAALSHDPLGYVSALVAPVARPPPLDVATPPATRAGRVA